MAAGRAVPRPLRLRVSLLEQCQYECAYCRPGSVVPPTASARWLSPQTYRRLGALFAEAGVSRVRFTGGEPLLRPDVLEVVAAFRASLPGADLALTTNGARLGASLDALVAAGLDRATVHVDSLQPERYAALMGAGELEPVLAAVLRARERLHSVKLNVVVQRGRNDDELADFLAWSARTGVEVRFIELMNTGSAVEFARQAFVSGREVVERIAATTAVRPVGRRDAADPAALYETGSGVVFGVIASDTQPFCDACNRLRLTADGRLRGCLYQADAVALGDAVRAGADDAALARLIHAATADKRSHHPALVHRTHRFSMADTGG